MSKNVRIESLKCDVINRKGSFINDFNPFVRDYAKWQSAALESTPVTVNAAFLLELVKVAPIDIYPAWSLAGEHLISKNGGIACGNDMIDDEKERLRLMHDLGLCGSEISSMLKSVTEQKTREHFFKPGTSGGHTEGSYPGWNFTGTDKVFASVGWVMNHSIRDYSKLIKLGWGGLLKKVRKKLSGLSISDPDATLQIDFLRAAEYVCKAGILLGKRYSEHAEELLAQTNDNKDKKRLKYMAENCAMVAKNGANSFRDAVQMLWFGHILTCGEDSINANSLGRIDQFLYPYYRNDKKCGKITREKALELMEELTCKLYLDYDVQAITLGGVDPEGNDAVNELSYIILDATENVGVIRDLSIRVGNQTPKEFIKRSSELIIKGGGIPFIFNDECFIKALTDRGIALRDARDYAPIGCVELTIPGKANPHAVSGWFNAAKCLELALYNGVDPASGNQTGPKTGTIESFKKFDLLYSAYMKQVRFFAERMVYHCNRGEIAQQQFGPLPCWSLLTDDCIERGHDITDGGAVYNYHSICFMGAPDVADSLFALKKALFDDRNLTAAEIISALKKNFKGHKRLQQQLKSLPKYGNNNKEVDNLSGKVSRDFIELMDKMESPLKGKYVVHLFTFKLNIPFGKAVGALPDGRNAGVPLAYSLSAHQGRDKEGITSMLKSLSRQPHNMAAGGSAAIIDIHPSVLNGNAGTELLTNIISTGLKMGIGQLQWNVVSAERLEQARQDPELYGNIPVRVAGYSQLFNLLDSELQEHIISRTKHQNA